MASLPLDVLIHILSLVPPARDRRDLGVLTLQNFLRVNTLFREAASISLLWKPHYQMRYRHSEPFRERERVEATKGDWRLMYFRRCKIDHDALKLLDKIVESRVSLQATLSRLVRQSLDVWDVIELEMTCPIPTEFTETVSDSDVNTEHEVPDHAICRRYWAQTVRDTIARAHGVSIWLKCKPGPEAPSFETMMSSLSLAFGVSTYDITALLDDLGARCRQELVEQSIAIDKTHISYDLRAICIGICVFMHKEGFTAFAGDQTDMLNKFPHAYLTTHKATIPISLVHIFVATAARLGIQAQPINFPGAVMSHVPALDRGQPPLIVNPSASNPHYSVPDETVPDHENPVKLVRTYYPQIEGLLDPCSTDLMLTRAFRNIAASFTSSPDTTPVGRSAALFIICITLMSEGAIFPHAMLRSVLTLITIRPVDCIFLLDDLAIYIRPLQRKILEDTCAIILEKERETERIQEKREGTFRPRYCVGMAIRRVHTTLSQRPDFIGSWQKPTPSNSLTRYFSFKIDPDSASIFRAPGGIYSVEENQNSAEIIAPIGFTLEDIQYLYRNNESFSVWFEGVVPPKDPTRGIDHPDGRGRLLLSPHAKYRYPNDSDAAAYWVEHGEFQLERM